MQELITWDLKKCSVSDLSFTEKVRLVSTVRGPVHGITSSFDCDMILAEGVKVKNVLSTSPMNPPTHWKQTTFLFDNAVTVAVGDVIEGTIEIRRKQRNERELQVQLKLNHNQTVICNQKYSVS